MLIFCSRLKVWHFMLKRLSKSLDSLKVLHFIGHASSFNICFLMWCHRWMILLILVLGTNKIQTLSKHKQSLKFFNYSRECWGMSWECDRQQEPPQLQSVIQSWLGLVWKQKTLRIFINFVKICWCQLTASAPSLCCQFFAVFINKIFSLITLYKTNDVKKLD